jgi:prepilin-type N-terminal cleavage/methylation domain-containing protein
VKRGFTLIELLIVVAIIAILAAIAVPNFLEAQTRAKVSRTLADMRSLATALETYTVDTNKPMTEWVLRPGGLQPNAITGRSCISASITDPGCVSARFIRLTTPIAYFTHVAPDPFAKNGFTIPDAGGPPNGVYDTYDYFTSTFTSPAGSPSRGCGLSSGATWRLSSSGPDVVQSTGGAGVGSSFNKYGVDYDPTNGTLSRGDIVRISGAAGIVGSAGKPGIDRVGGLKYN